MALELCGQAVGDWTIGAYRGNGYSGVVLEAERNGRTAAIKIIDPELVQRVGRNLQKVRVLRERDLVGHGHPHLVEIYDAGECERTQHLYVAMEMLRWPTIEEAAASFPVSHIPSTIKRLAAAARFLEGNGIAHRDIKPSNAVVSRDYCNAKLLDLGVIHPAEHPAADNAGTGAQFLGTARYSPPESPFQYGDEPERGRLLNRARATGIVC